MIDKVRYWALTLVAVFLTVLVNWYGITSWYSSKGVVPLANSTDDSRVFESVFMKRYATLNGQVTVSNTSMLRNSDMSNIITEARRLDILNTIKMMNINVAHGGDCHHHRFLVYECDFSRSCGGLADRQRGIVSSFLLAMATSRAFVINVDKPCSIENALIPHFYNWSMCRNYIKTVSKNNTKHFDFIDGNPFFKNIQNFDFERGWPWDIIFLKINSNIVSHLVARRDLRDRHTWLSTNTRQETYSLILSALFKPARTIFDYLNHFKKHYVREKSLVCSHVRTGGNPTIPKDNIFKYKLNETAVFNFFKQYADSKLFVLYLASDSNYIRNKFHSMFGNAIRTNGTVVHIDRLGVLRGFKRQACDGFKFAVIEQLILSSCDTLLITRGGFGANAAYMRHISNNLYRIDIKSGNIKQILSINKL
ncbi:uncharacterized protein LOC132745830 [Ruditapes philippinarum]|uniref:uncharacterized protein LOC132745830 n=1 Tax=Ruditapes philippinarum TaxID=129788 RepID=UPI00295B896F|nr:uncharacterized protein LOC132745830 [Ruditapes philippinarum]